MHLSRRITRLLAATFAAVLAALSFSAVASAVPVSPGGTVNWGFDTFVRGAFPALGTTGSGDPYRFVNGPQAYYASVGSPPTYDTTSFNFTTDSSGDYNPATQVVTLKTARSGTAGSYTEGGFVKLGYWVNGWASRGTTAEPTTGNANGLYVRFGELEVEYDLNDHTGTLFGVASAGSHGQPVLAPVRRSIATLSGGTGSYNPITRNGSATNITATLNNSDLGLGFFTSGRVLDPINLTFHVAP